MKILRFEAFPVFRILKFRLRSYRTVVGIARRHSYIAMLLRRALGTLGKSCALERLQATACFGNVKQVVSPVFQSKTPLVVSSSLSLSSSLQGFAASVRTIVGGGRLLAGDALRMRTGRAGTFVGHAGGALEPASVCQQVRCMGGKKMKSWSSYKRRFKLQKDGKFTRSRCGNAHLASSKSKTQKRRLRQSTTTHSGYASVMKRLGFKKSKYYL